MDDDDYKNTAVVRRYWDRIMGISLLFHVSLIAATDEKQQLFVGVFHRMQQNAETACLVVHSSTFELQACSLFYQLCRLNTQVMVVPVDILY